jgi:hypothetical protein
MEAGQDRHRPPASHQGARLHDGRWPARAQRLLEASYLLCIEGLHEPLRRCLDEAERALFALAEQARHPAAQQDFFASRQRLQQDRALFEQRFLQHIGAAIDDLGAVEATPAANTAWQSLELLDPVEQELDMAVAQLGARGDARHADVLHDLGYRLAVLVGAPPLEGAGLPLGPHALARAFHQAGAELQLPVAHHRLLLRHLESLIQSLGPVYRTIDAQLQADGILPRLRSIPVPRPAARSPRPAAAEDAATAAAESVHSAATAAGEPIEVLESLRNLLAQQRAGLDGMSSPAAGRTASPDQLQQALGALQQHLGQVTDRASRELRSAQRLREELLAQLNIDNPRGAPHTQLSGVQGDTVELVAMLFEQLGQQLQQGSNAYALLGDLQLPMLRMAVTDREFFEKREHPARQLLDTVTAAANEWLDGSDGESNHPLAAKLEQLVDRACREPPSAGLYTTLLADIEHHLALLARKAQAAERRHVEAAQGRERLDQARQRAGQLMAERFVQSPPRGLLRALLDRAWSDVLALTLLRHGEDSDAFDAQLAVTDQLLGRLPVDDPSKLRQDVETGLQQIGMHAEEAEQVALRLLGSDEAEPAADLPSATDLALRLKQHQRLGEQQPPPAGPVAASETKTVQETKTRAETVQETPVPAPVSPPAAATRKSTPDAREQQLEQHLRQLPFGSWFECVDAASGQATRRKLAWYSTMSGRCLMVSRRGQRGEEMTLAQLARDMANGRAREVPPQRESLLDRAWRGLTGSLRQPADAWHAIARESGRP